MTPAHQQTLGFRRRVQGRTAQPHPTTAGLPGEPSALSVPHLGPSSARELGDKQPVGAKGPPFQVCSGRPCPRLPGACLGSLQGQTPSRVWGPPLGIRKLAKGVTQHPQSSECRSPNRTEVKHCLGLRGCTAGRGAERPSNTGQRLPPVGRGRHARVRVGRRQNTPPARAPGGHTGLWKAGGSSPGPRPEPEAGWAPEQPCRGPHHEPLGVRGYQDDAQSLHQA